jgi:PBP1b-binding outer membrane lipoprotein LpoB
MKIFLVIAFSILFFSGCAGNDADTPTNAFRKYVEAAGKKDAAAMRENATRGSQKLIDETIKNPAIKASAPQTRNEKIEGERAQLEYQNAVTGTWDTIYFVRDNNRWKLALDESMETHLKESKAK